MIFCIVRLASHANLADAPARRACHDTCKSGSAYSTLRQVRGYYYHYGVEGTSFPELFQTFPPF